ncbi:hypothetical protein C4D60_Mb07t01210 [Musa balbisiana]|uniref:Ubiquitin-like domain-containing protein n=1 Tax=Musa balbisiana TaxID=52838 RepID=A0A4S8JC51_MUSBA|nr:hypothetical protein C4D60_Mb07t01210 [Musa balbisiana]
MKPQYKGVFHRGSGSTMSQECLVWPSKPAKSMLIYAGKQLADDKTAKEYNIEGGSVLHLVLALRGGCQNF